MYDCIVIGKGPAGITAAIYLVRAGVSCLVIGKDKGSLTKTEKIENYYGFEEPIEGAELIQRGINQATRLGVVVKTEEVLSIVLTENNLFSVNTQKKEYNSRFVILATGSNRNVPNIKGIKEFEGKGVSYCAICDAFFYQQKKVAVLGNGNYAMKEISDLLPVTGQITLLTNGRPAIEKRSQIKIIEKPIQTIEGNQKLERIRFQDDSKIEIDGLFIAEGTASSTDFARKLGAFLEGNNIQVDEQMQTNIPGLYAAGDCTGGILQISKATYDGTKAAFSIIKKLKKGGKRDVSDKINK